MSTNDRFKIFVVSFCVLFCLYQMQTTVQANDNMNKDKHKLGTVLNAYRFFKNKFPNITDISPNEARTMLTSGQAIFIDVREKEEQAVSMIKNARTVDYFLKNLTVSKGNTVVVYCTIGYRSGILARQLARHNIQVHNLAGGILAWVLSGGVVHDTAGETRRVHVYGNKWQFLPDGYEAVM